MGSKGVGWLHGFTSPRHLHLSGKRRSLKLDRSSPGSALQQAGKTPPLRPWASPPSCPSTAERAPRFPAFLLPRGRTPARRAGRRLPGCTASGLSPARRPTADAEVSPGPRHASSGRPGGGPWARGWDGAGGRGQPDPGRRAATAVGGSPRRSARRPAAMRRAGPWCLLLAAACALGQPPPPRATVRCRAAGACFSAHLANGSYAEARSACGRRQGGLAWVSGEPELRLVLGLLAEEAAAAPAPSLFWVGLKRNATACTDAGHPLRGFSWEGAGGGAAPRELPAALGRWVKEPVRSCLTARCAGLHLAAAAPDGGRSWGWKERLCQRDGQGYVCKYQEEGACPDLSPAGALRLDYRLPFQERSAGPGFSPPGTVLTVACLGGEMRLICKPERGGFAWKGAEEPLCPCGHGSPGSGRCAQAAGCRDAAGGFACACTPGERDGTPCAATGTVPAATAGAAGGAKSAAPPPSSFSSSSNYVFILVAVAVVVLVLLVMTVLGVFKLCFNKNSEGRRDKGPPEAGSKAEAGSAEPGAAAGGD